MSSERKNRVERHAYRIWEQEGRPHGRDKEHWHRAERDLAEPDDASAASSVATMPAAPLGAKRKAPAPKDAKQAKPAGAKPATTKKKAKPVKATKPAKTPARATKPAKTKE